MNRQGSDVGTQYRSIVLYHSVNQERVTVELISELNKENLWDRPIVTEVKPFEHFYEAEEDHKDYSKKHPEQAYCGAIVAPKIAKLQKMYFKYLRPSLG